MLDQTGRPLTLKQLYSMVDNKDIGNVKMNNVEILRDKAIQVEPKITNDIVNIISKVGGKPAGLEYRLKSLDSLKRKVNTEVLAGISEKQALNNIRDIIRYTAIFDDDNFVNKYQEMQKLLSEQGYITIIVKNTWQPASAYKGINTFVSTFIEKNNIIFEMQYHTKQSFTLKNGELHKLYEKFRDPETSQSEKEKIFLEMQKLSANLVVPKNIDMIKGKK